jgi:hypothetical protein
MGWSCLFYCCIVVHSWQCWMLPFLFNFMSEVSNYANIHLDLFLTKEIKNTRYVVFNLQYIRFLSATFGVFLDTYSISFLMSFRAFNKYPSQLYVISNHNSFPSQMRHYHPP